MTESLSSNSYDTLPYPRLSHKDTHPDRLSTLASLLGLTSPPVERSKILEIGCASGGNIIPMAQTLPGSKFVGIDLSERQIQEGQADIQSLGMKNVSLHKLDILDIDTNFGVFDYIIAHGIYSWVPPGVRDKLLAVCSENLAADGIAFVSYNVYPGWHSIDAIRQMMLYHTRLDTDLIVQATRAKELLDFLTQSIPEDSNYGVMLRAHNDYLSHELAWNPELNKSLLIHDHLSEYNDPVYFYRFAEHASSHGLQYLCDAELHTDFLSGFQPENAEKLLKMSHDLVELEQYMDFVRNRRFRRSLLVHDNREIDRQLKVERIFNLWIGSFTKPETFSFTLHADSPVKFQGHDGAVLTLSNPLSKAALLILANIWPEYMSFQSLVVEAQALLSSQNSHSSLPEGVLASGKVTPDQVSSLAADLLKAYIYSDSLVEVHSSAPPFTMKIGERPLASAWTRNESITSNRVTNLRHERVDLDIYEIHLLRLLDGTRDLAAILADIKASVKAGEFVIREGEEPITNLQYQMDVVAAVLDSKLQQLARAALLTPQ